MRRFRERLLARLVDTHAISQELAKRLSSWRHPGFSAHVGAPISNKGLKHNPTLGRNFEAMDPLEWLARMSDQSPDPGRHRTLLRVPIDEEGREIEVP